MPHRAIGLIDKICGLCVLLAFLGRKRASLRLGDADCRCRWTVVVRHDQLVEVHNHDDRMLIAELDVCLDRYSILHQVPPCDCVVADIEVDRRSIHKCCLDTAGIPLCDFHAGVISPNLSENSVVIKWEARVASLPVNPLPQSPFGI